MPIGKRQIEKHRFYKTSEGSWYIDLPNWTGPKGELQMVAGADTLLDEISAGKDEVALEVSVSPQRGFDVIEKVTNKIWGGADYKLISYHGEEVNKELWLCDVTRFVFNDFPDYIYFKKVE
jgi:hypothetical protein